jgi:hypothetical protein
MSAGGRLVQQRHRQRSPVWARALVATGAGLLGALLLAALVVPNASRATARWLTERPVRGQTIAVDGISPGVALPQASLLPRAQAPDSQSDPASVEADFEFNLLGAVGRWTGDAEKRAQLLVRTSLDGQTWSPWQTMELEAAQAEASAKTLVGEPLWVGRARFVEFHRSGPVEDLRLSLINSLGDATTSDRLVGGFKATVAALAGIVPIEVAGAQTEQPAIVTRAQWGADESWRRAAPSYTQVKMAFVHHTVSGNNYTADEAPAVVRAVYYYHAKTCGYNDIGYNFLIDRYGTIYEGRYGGIERGVLGAQVLGFNTGSTGIALIGTFTDSTPPDAALASLERLLAWKLDVHHVDPTSPASMVCGTTDKYLAGQPVTLPAISGHRDANYTACPGDMLYARLPEVRSVVDATGRPKIYAPSLSTPVISPDGDGRADSSTISFTASESVAWTATISDQTGAVLRSFTGTGEAGTATWDGRDGEGAAALDGSYAVTLAAANATGIARPAVLAVVVKGSSPTPTFHGVLRTEATRTFTIRRGRTAKFRYRIVYKPQAGDTAFTTARVILKIRDTKGNSRGTRLFARIPLNKTRTYAIPHCMLARGRYSYSIYATLPDGVTQQRIGKARFIVR